MATSIDIIYNRIIAYKQGLTQVAALTPVYDLTPGNLTPFQQLMNDISTASGVGRWRLQAYIFAAIQYFQEILWDQKTATIQAIVDTDDFGSLPWYANAGKLFQYGYSLVINSLYAYNYTDTTSAAAIASRIVTQCAATAVPGIGGYGIAVKVAQTVGGVLQPLSGPQVVSFTSYLNLIKPPGDKTTVINLSPDVVNESTIIYYDGTLDLPTFQAAIAAARKNLFTSGIAFNGLLYLNGINDRGTPQPGWVDTYLAVPGCLGVQVNVLKARPASSGTFTPITLSYLPASGYYVYDSGSTIQYIAQ